jgi:hypothetical protein
MRVERVSDSTSRRGFYKSASSGSVSLLFVGATRSVCLGDVKGKGDIYSQITEADVFYSFGCTKSIVTFHFILIRR